MLLTEVIQFVCVNSHTEKKKLIHTFALKTCLLERNCFEMNLLAV